MPRSRRSGRDGRLGDMSQMLGSRDSTALCNDRDYSDRGLYDAPFFFLVTKTAVKLKGGDSTRLLGTLKTSENRNMTRQSFSKGRTPRLPFYIH